MSNCSTCSAALFVGATHTCKPPEDKNFLLSALPGEFIPKNVPKCRAGIEFYQIGTCENPHQPGKGVVSFVFELTRWPGDIGADPDILKAAEQLEIAVSKYVTKLG